LFDLHKRENEGVHTQLLVIINSGITKFYERNKKNEEINNKGTVTETEVHFAFVLATNCTV
jgi:hypothetical protein